MVHITSTPHFGAIRKLYRTWGNLRDLAASSPWSISKVLYLRVIRKSGFFGLFRRVISMTALWPYSLNGFSSVRALEGVSAGRILVNGSPHKPPSPSCMHHILWLPASHGVYPCRIPAGDSGGVCHHRPASMEHRAPVFTIDARGSNIGKASMAVIVNKDVSLSWYKQVCGRDGRNVNSTA